MRVFVTGATGFVGQHLTRRLHDDGHDLVCLVRETACVDTARSIGATLVRGNVGSVNELSEGMVGCDCVVHLANIYSLWEPDPSVYQEVNVDGTRHVMEAALDTGVPKVVHVSTNLVWGRPEQIPYNETTEPGPVRFSAYAESKFQGDLIAWRLYEERGLPLVVLYPGSILGPGDEKFTGALIRSLMGRQLPARMFDEASFTYVHVTDVVAAIVAVMESPIVIGERYLIGNRQMTMGDFYSTVCEFAGTAPPALRLPDVLVPPTAWCLTQIADLIKSPPLWGLSTDAVRMAGTGTHSDGSKAERELGVLYTSLETALEETVAWVRDQESRETRRLSPREPQAR